jgi:hypothetical protein
MQSCIGQNIPEVMHLRLITPYGCNFPEDMNAAAVAAAYMFVVGQLIPDVSNPPPLHRVDI